MLVGMPLICAASYQAFRTHGGKFIHIVSHPAYMSFYGYKLYTSTQRAAARTMPRRVMPMLFQLL